VGMGLRVKGLGFAAQDLKFHGRVKGAARDIMAGMQAFDAKGPQVCPPPPPPTTIPPLHRTPKATK